MNELGIIAWIARESAYAPYSNYKVGCVLRLKDGNMITGANIENSIYSLTECAERVAIYKWKTGTWRDSPIDKLVYATDTPGHAAPCGCCLQVMMEHMSHDCTIAHYNGMNTKFWTLKELLPQSEVIKSLKKDLTT